MYQSKPFSFFFGFSFQSPLMLLLHSSSKIMCVIDNISKTSDNFLSGFRNTKKHLKSRVGKPNDLIDFECLETLMKHEAYFFKTASESGCNCKQKILYMRTSSFCFLLINYHVACDEK